MNAKVIGLIIALVVILGGAWLWYTSTITNLPAPPSPSDTTK